MKVVVKDRLNHTARLNDFLDEWNHRMEIGDRLECNALTYEEEYAAIRKKYPLGIGNVIVPIAYVWHDMLPKIKFTRKFYFAISGERHRSYSYTEILGRICRAGFSIVEEDEDNGYLHVIAEKKSEPLPRNDSTVSPLLKLNRIGKNREMIEVLKFRTMYSYSQYLQDYVYERNKLNKSGKLANDFRVNFWGRVLRPT